MKRYYYFDSMLNELHYGDFVTFHRGLNCVKVTYAYCSGLFFRVDIDKCKISTVGHSIYEIKSHFSKFYGSYMTIDESKFSKRYV